MIYKSMVFPNCAAEHGREAVGPVARSLRPGRWAAKRPGPLL